jgi:YD repeat-containing protein
VSVSTSAGAQILGYDALGRITGSTATVADTTYPSFSYTWNLADALVSTTYPTGRVVTNGYDGANRISAVTGTPVNRTPKTYVSGATYAAFGGIAGFNYAVTDGVAAGVRTFSYNGRMQLAEMKDQGASLLDLQYFYGGAATTGAAGTSSASNNGNPTGVLESAKKGSGANYTFTQTYGYGRLNRVEQGFGYGRLGAEFQLRPLRESVDGGEYGLEATLFLLSATYVTAHWGVRPENLFSGRFLLLAENPFVSPFLYVFSERYRRSYRSMK